MKPQYLIYALSNPCTQEIRYIGRSSSGLKRAKHHLNFSVYTKSKLPVHGWIHKLIKNGLLPKVAIIEDCGTFEASICAEIHYIQLFKKEGHRLLNCTDGGEGTIGRKVSQEVKERLSKLYTGKKQSVASIEKMRQAKLGKKLTAEHRKNIQAHSYKAKKVICVTTGQIFPSTREAAKTIKRDHKGIVECCLGRRNTCGGYTWKYECNG